jgi:hypothetical protein
MDAKWVKNKEVRGVKLYCQPKKECPHDKRIQGRTTKISKDVSWIC